MRCRSIWSRPHFRSLAERADRRRVFSFSRSEPGSADVVTAALPALRGAISARRPMVLRLDTSTAARAFASRPDLDQVATGGPACPDHLVHTKPWPLVLPAGAAESLQTSFRLVWPSSKRATQPTLRDTHRPVWRCAIRHHASS